MDNQIRVARSQVLRLRYQQRPHLYEAQRTHPQRETKKKLNFDNMVKILCDRSVEKIKYSHVLKRNKNKLSIFQTDMTKTWRVTYEKRWIIDDQFNTLPYGY